MPAPDHPIILGLYDYEWSAVSSIGTALAVVVALIVPAVLRVLDAKQNTARQLAAAKEAADARAAAAVHIADAFAEASQILWIARTTFNTMRKHQPAVPPYGERELPAIAGHAVRRAEVLRTLAAQPNVHPLGITAILGAARAMDTLTGIAQTSNEQDWNRFLRGVADVIEYASEQLNIVQMDLWDMLSQAKATYRQEQLPFFTNVYDES